MKINRILLFGFLIFMVSAYSIADDVTVRNKYKVALSGQEYRAHLNLLGSD